MIKKMNHRIKVFAAIVGSLFFVGGLVYYMQRPTDLYDFNNVRDLKPAVHLVEQNRYWLFEEGDDTDVEWILKHRSPYQYAFYNKRGKLGIKAARESGKLAGFVTYWKINFYEGQIQWLVVDSRFRKKGYGRKLLQYAVDDLFAQGCQVVELQTRLNNAAGISLYKKVGFVETDRDEKKGLIWFQVKKK